MNSELIVNGSGRVVCYVGPDATNLFRARTLKGSLTLWRRTKMIPTRGVTITKMLEMAKAYTGKAYTRKQVEQAEADIQVWIDTMTAALPVTQEKAK